MCVVADIEAVWEALAGAVDLYRNICWNTETALRGGAAARESDSFESHLQRCLVVCGAIC